MGGRVALLAEVAGRADNALAEVLLPDAIDDDAGGEWILGIDDGFGQVEAPLPCVKRRGGPG